MNKHKNIFSNHKIEILLSILLPIIFWSPFLKYPLRYLRSDFDVFITYLLANKISFQYFREFPYFSSYIGGGFFVWSNPQTMFFSIPQLISLIFNNQWLAIRISICILCSISMLGMFKLLKHMEIENLWIRLFGAIVYTFSGFIAAHLTMGHISFHNIVYIPWLASLFVWSHKNDKFSFAIPVLLAIMVYAGQNVPSIFIILILFSFLFYTKLKRFFIYILLGILLSLPKIISSYQLLSWFPRKLEIGYVSKSWIETFKVMIKALIWPNQQWLNYKSDSVVGAWELNGYVGILVLVLAIVCIIKYKTLVKQQKYIKSMLLVILFAVLLYPGNLNPIWYILSKNIAINSLHIPTRFIGLLSLPLAVLSAIGLYYISEKIIKRNNIILPVICIFIFWDYFRVNQPYFDHVQDKCTIENKSYFDKENNFTHDVGPDWNSISSTVFETDFMSKYLQDNKGVLQYFEALLGYDSYGFLRRSLVRGGNIGLYNKNPDINIKWISPSKVKVELTKNNKENMEIPININYLPGWRIISKKEGVSLNKDWTPSRWGLLTVFLDEKFPIGEKEKIELKFSPTLIVKLGFIIAIMTLMGIFVVAHLVRPPMPQWRADRY